MAITVTGTPVNAQGNSTTSIVATIGAPTNGNCLVAAVTTFASNQNPTGFAQAGWGLVTRFVDNANAHQNTLEFWINPNVQSYGTSVTLSTWASAIITNVEMTVCEVTGMGNDPALDQFATNSQGGTTAAATGTTPATTVAAEIAFALYGVRSSVNNTMPMTSIGSYTKVQSQNFTNADGQFQCTELDYLVLAATGTQSASGTLAASGKPSSLIVTIAPATALTARRGGSFQY